MEITKELKEKLLKANSLEEVRALLGDTATEEETARVWRDIQRHRAPDDLVETDDDELEAVSGGEEGDRDWLTQGCSATVEYDSWCWSDDCCTHWDTTYVNLEACPNGGRHDWEYYTAGLIPTPHRKCRSCGYYELLSKATGKPV